VRTLRSNSRTRCPSPSAACTRSAEGDTAGFMMFSPTRHPGDAATRCTAREKLACKRGKGRPCTVQDMA
jgi:hypothetical protein